MVKSPAMVEGPQFPSLKRLLRGFCLGGGYLALVSGTLAAMAHAPYLVTLLVVLATAVALFMLSLAVALRWSLRVQQGRFQLELASIFLLVAIVSVYLAAVRWLISGAAIDPGRLNPLSWADILFRILLLSLLAAPFVLLLGDSILALAAWLVWRPWVQAVLRRWFRG